jgi:hypothetical protein
VADTGDTIERKIAEILPNYFGADWSTSTGTPNNKDTRSDNKGPEPEGLAVGKVFGRTVAFVGLERIGGVMAFDISNPTKPEYLTYVNSSIFSGVGGANFATAGAPAGDVAHELSGTTAIYKIVGTQTKGSQPFNVTSRLSKTKATVSWTEPEDDGGRPITSYVVISSPDKKYCTTTKTTCVVKGLQPGVKYTFTVNARSGGELSAASVASNSVQVAYFPTPVGKAVAITKQPAKIIATSVGVFTKNLNVSVAAVTPRAMDKSKQVVRYAIELRDATGNKVSSSKVSVGVATTATATLTASQKGRYRVVITAGFKNGTKSTWNGPLITFK